MKLPENYNRGYQLDLEQCMGNGINIKYFEAKNMREDGIKKNGYGELFNMVE